MSDTKAVVSSPEVLDADQLDGAEYQALETALLQTARGRNFLTEYLRRNGGDTTGAGALVVGQGQTSNDTNKILQAVENLHSAILDQQKKSSIDHTRMDILDMAKAISKTRNEIAAMRTDGDYDHLSVASEEMDAIVLSTEKATDDILQAAEKIQEVAWHLREKGAEESSCEDIDNSATDIYMACSFQDLTGQRTTKVVRVLQYLEARINSMIEIWGLDAEGELPPKRDKSSVDKDLASMDERPDAHLLNGPQSMDAALGQDNIDALLNGDDAFAAIGNDDEPEAKEDASFDEAASDKEIDDVMADSAKDETIDEEQLKALFS